MPEQDSQRFGGRTGRPPAGGTVRRGGDHRTRARRTTAHRLVVDHRDRRSRRADSRRAGPVVGTGQRLGQGMHRRGALPIRHRLLRGEGAGYRGARRCRRHQPRATGHRRHLRRRGAARTSTARRRRGTRAGGSGDQRGHRRAVQRHAQRGQPARRAACRARTHTTAGGRDGDVLVGDSRCDARSHRSPRRRDDDVSHRAARRREQGALGDRHVPVRPQGRVGPRRGGDGVDRHQRYRVADRRVVRPGDSRPGRRGVAGPRGQPRERPGGHAGGTPLGGGPVARQAVRAVHGGADLGHTDRRRELRRDGRGLGTDRRGGRETSRSAVSTSDLRSSTPSPGSSTSPPICRRRGATAPALQSSSTRSRR